MKIHRLKFREISTSKGVLRTSEMLAEVFLQPSPKGLDVEEFLRVAAAWGGIKRQIDTGASTVVLDSGEWAVLAERLRQFRCAPFPEVALAWAEFLLELRSAKEEDFDPAAVP